MTYYFRNDNIMINVLSDKGGPLMYEALQQNLEYLKVTDSKNISDTLFKRFRDLIVMG